MGKDEQSLEEEIVEFVRQERRCTIPRLMDWLAARGMTVKGETMWKIGPDIVLWSGMEMQLAETLERLCNAGRLHLHKSTPCEHLADGAVQALRVAQDVDAAEDRGPCWLPVVFCVEPMEAGPYRALRMH